MKWNLTVLHLVLSMAIAGAQQRVDEEYMNVLRLEISTNHPAIAAARHRIEAARAGVGSVRYWEDPTAGVSITAAKREMRRDDGDFRLGLEQTLPRPSLYRARRSKAAADFKIRAAHKLNIENTLALEVSQLVIELALTDEKVFLQEQQLQWLRSMTANATERLKNPNSQASEPLRLESELALEVEKLKAAKRNRELLSKQLNVLLGRHHDHPWPQLAFPTDDELSHTTHLEFQKLLSLNPSLAVLRRVMESAETETKAVREERRPVFSVGIDAGFHAERGNFRDSMLTLKMTIPWLHRSVYDASESKASKEHLATEQDLLVHERELQVQVIKCHTQAQNAAAQTEALSKIVIPKTKLAAESIESSWISSKATLMEVLDARRSLLSAQLEERRSVASQRSALEELRALAPSENKIPPIK